MSVIIMGGYLVWQENIIDKYRSLKPFSMELKAKIGDLTPSNIAFFRKYAGEILFYMDLPEPVIRIESTKQLNGFLSSEAKTKVLISHGDYNNELLAALPEWVPEQPTLKEKIYPWEKKKKYEAWIIQNERK